MTSDIQPTSYQTEKVPVSSAIEAYRNFDQHKNGWLKVKLESQAELARVS